ncbi:MAG: cupin domain-containing protein [Dehalococcoidia bacterium]|nr:cupin domain-containing protein [Dehalococcoidia bacterium]
MSEDLYPPIIRDLPLVDLPFKGIHGYLLQGACRQVVFFEIEATAEIPEHSHGAQWGVVLEGELELTIAGVTHPYRQGDSYYIPADAAHSVIFKGHVKALDVFAEANRYRAIG